MKNRIMLIALSGLLSTSALAAPAQLAVTYSDPSTSDTNACFDLDAGPVLPPEAKILFLLDEVALADGIIELADIDSATFSYGDASWATAELSNFLYETTEIGSNFDGLSFSFASITTPSTSNAAASGTETGLEITGNIGGRVGGCQYFYNTFSFSLTPVEENSRDFSDNGLSPSADIIRGLTASGDLRSRDAEKLERPISDLYTNFKRADIDKANVRLEQFDTRINQLERTRRLSGDDADSLRASSAQTRRVLDELGFNNYFVDTPDIPACRTAPECQTPTLFVDDDAAGAPSPEGSLGNPFALVRDALTYAETNGFSCATVSVAPGQYREGRVQIEQDTSITGASSESVLMIVGFENTGDHFFSLSDVAIDNSIRSFPAIETVADAACTVVRDVFILSASDFGIAQSGGALTVDNVRIFNTTATGSEFDSGYAVRLDEGANACLSDLSLTNNRGGALLADGADTRVFVNRLDVRNTDINSTLRDALQNGDPRPVYAAVHARNQALLLGENVNLINSELAGIGVTEGARANFQVANVDFTRDPRGVPQTNFSGSATYAAFTNNVDSLLQMSAFTLRRADLAGLVVGEGSFVNLDEGNIEDNPVGSSTRDEVFIQDFLDACIKDVRYLNNQVNFDSPFLSAPTGLLEWQCSDGLDNDDDGLIDCVDSDCEGIDVCESGYIPPASPVPVPPPTICPSVVYNPSWCAGID